MPLDVLFDEVLRRGGSDLHLAVNQPPLARVRGEMVTLKDTPLAGKELEEMLLAMVSQTQRTRLAADLELDHTIAHRDGARFRAVYYVKQSGIAAAFRVVPERIPPLADLGAPEALRRLVERRSGLLVIGGPLGSGKTTTVASIVHQINQTRPCHILTIDNPIEFTHDSIRAQVTQREVGVHVPSAAVALKFASRENPDVVVVPDYLVADEIELALRLAEGGCLVLMTRSTSGVVPTIERLLATFEAEAQIRARSLLASSLAGIVVQHLVPAADGKGRVAAHEIFIPDESTSSLVAKDRTSDLAKLVAASGTADVQSLATSLEKLVAAGKITPEARDRVVRVAP